MYVPARHRFDEREALFALMAAHPLGGWVCHGVHGLVANHVPFFLDRTRGPHGTLVGHVSRANGVWRALGAGAPSVVMFQGPQAYVTPGWYPGKAEHGEVVPTWNYVVAHVHGVARAVDDRGWLLGVLNRLTDEHEARQALPWRVGDAPAAFVDRLLRAVVGIEITIDRIDGKLKASQDEALPDREGTVRGLRDSACPWAQAMAGLVSRAIEDDAAGAAG